MELSATGLMKGNTPKDAVITLQSQKPPQQNGDMARKKRLRRQVDQLVSNSTINGLSQAFSAEKRNYRIFWSALFVLGLVGFGINLYHIVDNYVQGPILTQLDHDYTPFQWPHFTICNPSNPIPFWTSSELEPKWKKFFDKAVTYRIPKYGIQDQEHRLRKLWDHDVAMSSIDPQEFYRNGVKGNVFVVSIKHRETSIGTSSGRFDNFHNVRKIKQVFLSTLDSLRAPIPCYTLAPENLAAAVGKKTLRDKLLSIKIYIIMDFKSHKIFNPGYESRKIYFYLTHPNVTLQSSTPNFILAGTVNHFDMKQNIHKRINDCRKKEFTVELYDTTMSKTRHYVGGFDDCRMHLSQQIFFEECKCYNPNLPLYKFDNNLPRLCTNMSIYDNVTMAHNVRCLNRVIREDVKSAKFEEKVIEKCARLLQPTCMTSNYAVTRATDVWQDDMCEKRRERLQQGVQILPNAPPNANETFNRQNLAVVTLSWNRQPTEVTYEQYEYLTSQFVSDIGGIAGLWIGLSVISIFEIMELLFVFCKSLRA